MGSSSIFFAELVAGEFSTLRYGWDSLLFRYTNLQLLKKMCHKDPLWCNNSQNMKRFEKSIRSIVKNIGSERAEPCWQYLAYFVRLSGILFVYKYQHLKNRRGSHCWSNLTPIGLKRPEIRWIAVWHSNSPVIKVDLNIHEDNHQLVARAVLWNPVEYSQD